MYLAMNGSDEVNLPDPDVSSFRPGWIQCRIGPSTPKEGNGASRSRLMHIKVTPEVALKLRVGGAWASDSIVRDDKVLLCNASLTYLLSVSPVLA